MNIAVLVEGICVVMEPQKEYSVFDDMPVARPKRYVDSHQKVLYFLFLGYFIILAFIRWGAFISAAQLSLTGINGHFSILHPPHLLSAISLSLISACSAVLFYRRSIRASIGLLIFGALLELVVFHFMEAY
jgi:hypothetical protein